MTVSFASAGPPARPFTQLVRNGQSSGPTATAANSHAQRIDQSLKLLAQQVPVLRRMLHAGDAVYRAGQCFTSLHVIHLGCFKVVHLAPDGREQIMSLMFKGDWLGFEGIADGTYGCDAIAIDTGEVWSVRYDALLRTGPECPALQTLLHSAMSQEMTRGRAWLLSLCTLGADARVAEFLLHWVDGQAQRGMRTDQITLRMTRAEIGNYLGMTLESVSRAMSRLAREHLIDFTERGRRELHVPDLGGLARFVQSNPASRAAVQ